jgi:hypothetical protein
VQTSNLVEWVHTLLDRIARGDMLAASYYGNLDCDDALDARDSDKAFDSAWCEAWELVEARRSAADPAPLLQDLVDRIRKASFLAVSNATGQHEVASYVSDDFDLIVRGRAVDAHHEALDRLYAAYERGEFPVPSSGGPAQHEDGFTETAGAP